MQNEPRTFDFSHPGLWIPTYRKLFADKRRRKLLIGGRDAGRSTHVAQGAIVTRMLREKFTGLMIRKAYNSIKESQFNTIKLIVEKRGLEDLFAFKVAPLEIVCLDTGARMIAKGMDNPGKAKSVPDVSLAWYEECDELTLEDFTQTTLSLRGHDVEEWLTCNTPTTDHWIAKRFFPQLSDGTVDLSFEQSDGSHTFVESSDPTCTIVHTCHLHNTFLTEERRSEYEWMKANMPEEYRRDGLGLFGRKNIGSLWLKHFDRSRHIARRSFNPMYPVHLTFDQNRLPYNTCLMVQVVPVPEKKIKEVRVLQEFCLKPPKNSSEHACDEFIYHYGEHRPSVYIYGDPSGASGVAQKTKNEAKSHYDAIEQALRPFLAPGHYRVARSHPSINGRQRFMERLLAEGIGELRLVIDPGCKNIIGDFEHLVEDGDGGFIKKIVKDKETEQSWQERGHAMDSLIYLFHKRFPDEYKAVVRV